MVMPIVTEIAPAWPIDAGAPAESRLSTVIARARMSRDPESYLEERTRAHADRVFSELTGAVERALSVVQPRSADARVLKQLRDALHSRGPRRRTAGAALRIRASNPANGRRSTCARGPGLGGRGARVSWCAGVPRPPISNVAGRARAPGALRRGVGPDPHRSERWGAGDAPADVVGRVRRWLDAADHHPCGRAPPRGPRRSDQDRPPRRL